MTGQLWLTHGPNLVVLGGDGRGHTLWDGATKSHLVGERDGQVFFAPGNGGVPFNLCYQVDPNDFDAVMGLVRAKQVGFLVVSAEKPLCRGIVDYVRLQDGPPVFGPSMDAAHIEGSKGFAYKCFLRWGVPTPESVVTRSIRKAHKTLKAWGPENSVIKADGLCEGKGVELPETPVEAYDVLHRFMVDKVHGKAGETVVIQRRRKGRECSIIALTDGVNVCFLPESRDQKLFNKRNTGGTGAYSPVPDIGEGTLEIMRRVTERIVAGLRQAERLYRGSIYVGFILTENGPEVLEVNCRFGDPEAEVIIPRLHSSIDLLELMLATTKRNGLAKVPRILPTTDDAVVSFALMSKGYPGDYKKGLEITDTGKDNALAWVRHAGTKWSFNGKVWETTGGRVAHAVGRGKTMSAARRNGRRRAAGFKFKDKQIRTDIGLEAVR